MKIKLKGLSWSDSKYWERSCWFYCCIYQGEMLGQEGLISYEKAVAKTRANSIMQESIYLIFAPKS